MFPKLGNNREKVLFLCTGNSCRSQMAEGYIRHLGGDRFQVSSAGLNPGAVNPNAVRVMNEDGVDISNHRSKDVNQFIEGEFDYIITVCDHAKERCPLFPGDGIRVHWSFPDPAEAVGTEEEVLTVFRSVRDQIKSTIIQFMDRQ